MSEYKPTPLTLPYRPGQQLHHAPAPGLGLSYLLVNYLGQHPAFFLCITPDMHTANLLAREVEFLSTKTIPSFIFPDWEILPYDSFSPHQDIISERLLALHQLPSIQHGICFLPMSTLMHRLAPRSHLEQHSFVLAVKDQLNPQALSQRLERNGYHHVSQVIQHGEFCVRGAIIDLFPMGSKYPYRIELFDDEVESLRSFDPETQISVEKIDKIQLLPAKEYPLTAESISAFRQAWRMRFAGNPARCPVYDNISRGEAAPGIEYFLPLFFNDLSSIFDYLPEKTVCTLIGDSYQYAEQFMGEVTARYDQLGHDTERPILAPHDVLLPTNDVFAALKNYPQLVFHLTATDKQHPAPLKMAAPPDLRVDHKAGIPTAKLSGFLATYPGRVLCCAETAGRREVLLDLFHKANLRPTSTPTFAKFLESDDRFAITTAPIESAVMVEQQAITIITESQLFGEQTRTIRRQKKRVADPDAIIRDLTELKVGAPVVHVQHGVGCYKGLEIITTGDITAEYLHLEYANKDKLYVPVSSLELISRFTGGPSDSVNPHRLGSGQWEKAKLRAAKRARDVAVELLHIYAQRQAKTGHTFTLNEAQYEQFATSFPFQVTDDQARAIDEVIRDLCQPRCMDRLVCGDVGFGKTEVAMRAAFVAANGGKQVAMLVPTTLLCEQHASNFMDRFADWPLKIVSLSRFRTSSEQNQIIEGIKSGHVDIVIATHKLLQADIHFKDLGLMIIDEEHRFGVRQKDKLKAIRAEVDILALTATPIPRTLNLSLAGIRDLSIIATPPARRLSIHTFVRPYQTALIREAIMRETLRGGQVYFLHNEVKTIQRYADEIRTLVPEARVIVAHGQMPERELEKIMTDFYHQRFNVLVCTTIIESGIDIPTANTIIIHRADKFGLAQLHQLRGRVGRSHHQAYAYLLTPEHNAMTKDAHKRLEAISSIEDLGAGFVLATNDLEIRGAGELLGDEQSGHINEIGFSLYMELIDNAVKALKAGHQPAMDLPLNAGPEIDLGLSSLIPDDYVGDVNLRLTLYKRVASASDSNELRELQVEFIDRFGLLPDPCKRFFTIAELKLQASQLGITKISGNHQQFRMDFSDKPNININTLMRLVNKESTVYRFINAQRISVKVTQDDPLHCVRELLTKLAITTSRVTEN